MKYVLALKTNTPAELLTSFARLQSGGFHPFVPNFHHGTIAAGYILALGGFDIHLPDHEIEDAKIWMSNISPIEDYDPIIATRRRDIIYASVLSINPIFGLYCLAPAVLFCIFGLYIFLLHISGGGSFHKLILGHSPTLCIIGILAHARHIAVPKMRHSL